jgi:hypothetical protein
MARASIHIQSAGYQRGSDLTIECIGVGAYDMKVPYDLVGNSSIPSGWRFYKGPTRI